MDPFVTALIVVLLLLLFLGSGTWIFSGLILVSGTSLWLILDFPPDRIGSVAKQVMHSSAISWELAAVPMFIWMGDIIFRTDISQRLFRGLAPMVHFVPGGLLHTNVAGCTMFAAVSGSSTATTATIGKITIGELRERGYDVGLSSGSLCGAGSFGLLIPPSISMIIYGVLAEVSIARLFAAGILPGLLMAGLYSGYIMLRCLANPALAPRDESVPHAPRDVLMGLLGLLPVVLLIVVVLGSIYTGVATPSEAAAVGTLAALLLVGLTGQLSWTLMRESILSAVRISCMICTLIVASAFLSTTVAYLHLPQEIARGIAALELGPYGLLLILALFYILLGMFLDGISIIVLTLPIALPLIASAGFDPIWFGIFLVVMIELSGMTPPVGLNLYILQGLTGRTVIETARSAMPFFFLLCLGVVVLAIFPQIVLWLPRLLYG